MTDRVQERDRVQGRHRVFDSREEVEGHLSQLGEGVIRIFVALSCDLGGFFIYIILYCITRHNFSPTRSVTSGNCTPGSRFYSDLLDTLADSIYIHQVVLKALGCSYNCRRLAYDSFQLRCMSRDVELN